MLGFRFGVRVSPVVRVSVRFSPTTNRSTYVGSPKLCGISENASFWDGLAHETIFQKSVKSIRRRRPSCKKLVEGFSEHLTRTDRRIPLHVIRVSN